jgi:undecaprenyl-diphosphatase
MKWITMMGATLVLLMLGIVVVIIFLWAEWRREVLLFLVTMGGAAILNRVLKLAFQRPRPEPYFDLPVPNSFSFPSGHALLSLCFYGALAILITSHLRSRRGKVAVWILTAILILLIGLSRIYLGMHFGSDVVAGFSAAFIWITTLHLAQRIWQLASDRRPQ